MRTLVTYKGHKFIAIADGAGLDVECVAEPTDEVMKLGSQLWSKIFETRLSLFGADAEEDDTTPYELMESLKELKLV